MVKSRYVYWPIRLIWAREPFQRTLLRQIWYAIGSYFWTMERPYRFSCREALRVHQKAARRPWHGWPQHDGRYGWTLHVGRLKVVFGGRFNPEAVS